MGSTARCGRTGSVMRVRDRDNTILFRLSFEQWCAVFMAIAIGVGCAWCIAVAVMAFLGWMR